MKEFKYYFSILVFMLLWVGTFGLVNTLINYFSKNNNSRRISIYIIIFIMASVLIALFNL